MMVRFVRKEVFQECGIGKLIDVNDNKGKSFIYQIDLSFKGGYFI